MRRADDAAGGAADAATDGDGAADNASNGAHHSLVSSRLPFTNPSFIPSSLHLCSFALEPGDEATHDFAKIAGTVSGLRPNAVNIPYDRENKRMDLAALEGVPKDAKIITHCGGGGRGQKAKDYLIGEGFTNVMNG